MANTANQVLTFEKLAEISKDILETCPIAHYLRVSTIPVSFSTVDQTSYFDSYNFEIVIAFNNIIKSITNKANNNNNQIKDVDLEKTIRGLLYHEISHALLTPQSTKQVAYDRHQNNNYIVDADLENIIEDERIETINKHYFLNVDFKRNLRSIVPLENATDFKHFVFNAVRFRYCPIRQQEVNEQVKLFIENTKSINAASGSPYRLVEYMEALCKYLLQVWNEWLALQNANQAAQNNTKQGNTTKQQPQSEQDTKGDEENAEDDSQSEDGESDQETEDSQSEDGDSENIDDDTDGDTESEEDSSDENANDDNPQQNKTGNGSSQSETDPTEEDCESDELTDEEIEQMARMMADAITQMKQMCSYDGGRVMKLSDFVYENETFANLYKVIIKNQGFGNKQSPIRYGYCGTLNAKRFMKDHNETFKWFEKKSFADDNNGNKQAKKILNIFLDNSGSFNGNDYEVNKILSALQDIERKVNNFEFRLVRWGDRATIEQGENRISNSYMGTQLDATFVAAYKQLNQTNQEYNIFLTDGSIGGGTIKNVALFNNNHSVIISQSCNISIMQRLCPNCRAIIEEDQHYAEQLKINIAKALDALF